VIIDELHTSIIPPSRVIRPNKFLFEQSSFVCEITGGTPTETVFYLPGVGLPEGPTLIFEQGAHPPFPGGPSVPFHQDPAQRIIVLWAKQHPHYIVIQVGALLQLAEGREGCEIMWEELGDRAFFPLLDLKCERVRVSGCRLFSVHRNEDDFGAYTSVYDFSAGGLAKYTSKQVDRTHDSATTPSKLIPGFQSGARYLSPTGASAQIPSDFGLYPTVGYDNLLLFCVSVVISCPFGDEAK